MRQLLGHPILPGENFFTVEEIFPELNEHIDFHQNVVNEFGLKYLAKFVFDKRVENFAINGNPMPLNQIKQDSLILLNLSECHLYSEDLFILSQFLKANSSITHINLSRNCIGLNNSGLHESLGLEHFAIALSKTSAILELDISLNDIGPENFALLQKIFLSNINLELLNIANCGIDGQQTIDLCEGLM